MKKVILFLAGVFLLLLTLGVNAQANEADYFAGKWKVTVFGTPDGDAKMTVSLERADGKLTGGIISEGTSDANKFTKIDETEKSVTLYFTANGYDVYLLLENKGDNHVEGNLLGMFDAKGDRIAEGNK
jgi:hypothetical protein